jgi:hypothetical protein
VSEKLQGPTSFADIDLNAGVFAERRVFQCAATNCAGDDARNDQIRVNEEVLISRILEGEKDLFLELIRPYQRTLYATLISMLRKT